METKNSRRLFFSAPFFLILLALLVQVSTAQWIKQTSPVKNSSLTDVVMLDSARAVVCGTQNVVLRTTNAGTVWDYIGLPYSMIIVWNSVSFFDVSNGIIVGDHMPITTTDGGATWTGRPMPGTQKCSSALHVGPSNIYVGADSGWVYHTLDTGNTWSAEKISTRPIRSLFAYRGPVALGLPVFALTPNSLCMTTVYPGGPWAETLLQGFLGLGSEAFHGEYSNGGGPGFIVGVQGDLRAAPAILKKGSSDTSWRNVAQNIFRDGCFNGVSAPSANVIYVCGTGGMIFKSLDGGESWTACTVPTSQNLRAISFIDENHGFAVGDSGTILYTNNGGGATMVHAEQSEAPLRFELEQNYPNPFNPMTAISYRLTANSFVTLTVYDVLGREMASLVNEERPAGNYSVRWDATNFRSGVYFYRLKAGSFVETKKATLVK